MLARNPTGRMGKPQEVADVDAVVFLASARASFITGANLIIDGALTQRVQYREPRQHHRRGDDEPRAQEAGAANAVAGLPVASQIAPPSGGIRNDTK